MTKKGDVERQSDSRLTRKAQGAVEYIIILGVIILIALTVVTSLGGLGIFNFSTSAQVRTTEISNQLQDVGFTYVVDSAGSVQVSIKSNTNKKITAYNMSITNGTGGVCYVLMSNTVVRQNYQTFSNSSCSDYLSGASGEPYEFNCTMRYEDANGIKHAVKGTCQGIYEEV